MIIVPTDCLVCQVAARVKNVTDVILYLCPEDRDKNRGFAFVEFEDHMCVVHF